MKKSSVIRLNRPYVIGSQPATPQDGVSNLIGVVPADRFLDLSTDPLHQLASKVGLALGHKPVVVVGPCVSLSAQGIELRNEISFWIDRVLESLYRAVVCSPPPPRTPREPAARSAAVAEPRIAS